MAISEAVKHDGLQAMETAHRRIAARLGKRLRIFNYSLDDWKKLWRFFKQLPFISFADAEPFDAKSAEAFVENSDAMIAELAGVSREQVVVLDIYQGENVIGISASQGEGPEAPALGALVFGLGGEAKLMYWGPDRTWHRGADGGLRLYRIAGEATVMRAGK